MEVTLGTKSNVAPRHRRNAMLRAGRSGSEGSRGLSVFTLLMMRQPAQGNWSNPHSELGWRRYIAISLIYPEKGAKEFPVCSRLRLPG
jgi:hypothetical protein